MFIFSKQHAWQGNDAVQQILVFTNNFALNTYEIENRQDKVGIFEADDNNIGAIFKLRAVRDGKGMYIPIIRCGVTGCLLYEDRLPRDTAEEAIEVCLHYLKFSKGE